jgi:prephenate dehydrogenase
MFLFNKVAIIGTGLIGGSLALAIKKNKLARRVVGVSRRKKSLSLALKLKAIDRGSLSFEIIKGADLVVIATPVDTILSLEKRILKYIDNDCIIIDVGSTKEKIVNSFEKIFPNFIGTHPLAGSEKRGIINASARIFENSLCILTPTLKTSPSSLNKVRELWKKLGAKTVILTPKAHDRILSFTSHLAHVIAFSLINSIPQGFSKFASSGLKDTTRIAASDALLWKDIFLSNSKNVLKAIEMFEGNLAKIKSAVKSKNTKSLEKILLQSKKKRESLK